MCSTIMLLIVRRWLYKYFYNEGLHSLFCITTCISALPPTTASCIIWTVPPTCFSLCVCIVKNKARIHFTPKPKQNPNWESTAVKGHIYIYCRKNMNQLTIIQTSPLTQQSPCRSAHYQVGFTPRQLWLHVLRRQISIYHRSTCLSPELCLQSSISTHSLINHIELGLLSEKQNPGQKKFIEKSVQLAKLITVSAL